MPSILYLTQSKDTLPSVRFRVLPLIQRGREAGFGIERHAIPKAFHKRLIKFMMLPKVDVIIIQKKLFAPRELGMLRRKCVKLIYDFDDAVWTHHPSEAPGARRNRRVKKLSRRFAGLLTRVDQAIAGNEFLADKARPLQSNLEIIPTPIDTGTYVPPQSRPKRDIPVVGWMGTSANLFFLPPVLEVLSPHAERLNISVVADKEYEDKHAEMTDFEYWDGKREVAQLQDMDIGLMPLTDDEYTRGKCGFKILQYMACGVVPVASNVGFNAEIITHGKDGFLVNEPVEWAEYVLMLAQDPELRRTMAAEARKTVVDRFSLDVVAKRFWKAVDF